MESASTPPPPFPFPGGGSCPTLHAWRPLVVSVNPLPAPGMCNMSGDAARRWSASSLYDGPRCDPGVALKDICVGSVCGRGWQRPIKRHW
jgi:hypothetical protein